MLSKTLPGLPTPGHRITRRTPPSLVPGTGITSSNHVLLAQYGHVLSVPVRLTPEPVEHLSVPTCPDGGWLRGSCKEHGTVRWVKMSCKRRTCEVCGQERKERIAWRISRGIEMLGGEDGAGWQVLTFDRKVAKSQAVRISNQFIQWLARYMKRTFKLKAEWAKVWELHRSGQLHLNLLMAPWRFIPQSTLARKWHALGGGIVTWIERVGAGIGVEAAKSRYKMGLYLAKYDQMVLSGRGVSYSKNFPKLPELVKAVRRGEIAWHFVGNYSEEGIIHWYDTELGNWHEVSVGEWAYVEPERCDCFEFKLTPVEIARRMREAFKWAMEIERG